VKSGMRSVAHRRSGGAARIAVGHTLNDQAKQLFSVSFGKRH